MLYMGNCMQPSAGMHPATPRRGGVPSPHTMLAISPQSTATKPNVDLLPCKEQTPMSLPIATSVAVALATVVSPLSDVATSDVIETPASPAFHFVGKSSVEFQSAVEADYHTDSAAPDMTALRRIRSTARFCGDANQTFSVCFPVRQTGEWMQASAFDDIRNAETEWQLALRKPNVNLRLTKSADSVSTLSPSSATMRARRYSRATIAHYTTTLTESCDHDVFLEEDDDASDTLSQCEDLELASPQCYISAPLSEREGASLSSLGVHFTPLWDTSPLLWNARRAQFDLRHVLRRKLRIAIVDDSDTTCKMVARQLQNAAESISWLKHQLDGKPVCTLFGDGNEIDTASNNFHLIVTDFDMPNVNGAEVARHSTAVYPSKPVCVMSGSVNEERRDVCKSAGAIALIAKPLTKQHAATLIALALQNALSALQ